MNTQSTSSGSRTVNSTMHDLRSIWQVMRDPSVPGMWKWLLPIGAFLYLIWPLDLMPFLPFDDIAVVILAMSMFLKMMAREPQSSTHATDAQPGSATAKDDKTIDTTWRVVDK